MDQLACDVPGQPLETTAVPDSAVARQRYEALLETFAPAIRRTSRLYERDPGGRLLLAKPPAFLAANRRDCEISSRLMQPSGQHGPMLQFQGISG